jgi:RNA polymerase sigma-70 factor (ECF subfamily)
MQAVLQTVTTTALLEALLEPGNEEIWRQFDERYRPVIVSFCRRLGLEPADSADVAQETLTQFVRDYRGGKYDRSRGRLSAWIIGIAKHRIGDIKRSRAARREFRGHSAIAELPDDDRLGEYWEAECRQAMFSHAMRELTRTSRVSARTIEAFRLHVIEQQPPEEVAIALGTSVRAIYLAKHRCLTRLRTILEDLKTIYDAD